MAACDVEVDCYIRCGVFGHQDRNHGRDFMRPLCLTADEKVTLVACLKSLTDERVRFEKAPFDLPQRFIPNGHPGDENHVVSDGTGKAKDDLIEIKAVGAGGGPALAPGF